jgi:hypothetical protein
VKRFSAEEVDREFEFGGEIFKWQVPYWEDIANRLDLDVRATQAAIDKIDGKEPKEGVEELPDTAHGVTEDFIKRIEMFLDPENESLKRWRALTKRKKPAVPLNAFKDLHQWLLEVTTKRDPTEPSSSS